jgi:abequosyltransferase
MNKKPYLSICIPTYNRLEILKKTLDSIYSDLADVDLTDFEVVISDNEPNQSTKIIIDQFHFDNLYYHPTTCSGFLNSFEVLKFGTGMFLKLHNNYTMFRKGSLKKMIAVAKENQMVKPVMFFTNGLGQNGKAETFDTYDAFMYRLSYLSSWSSGFGIWKEDFEIILNSIDVNNYFPQTSILMTQFQKTNYIINDIPLFDNQDIPNKGGYNIFKVFSVDFISLIEMAYNTKQISQKTFDKIKIDLLLDYLSVRYFKTVIARMDNFEKKDIKKNIEVHYSTLMYYVLILTALFSPVKTFIRKMKVFFFIRKL